ncbi:hypothetical protein BGZ72_003005, partial [Mortierella alpina]
MFGHGQYRHASLQDDQRATHYKLKGTVVTNGHVVHLLAYDTNFHRPTAAREERRKGRTDIRLEFWELEGEGEEEDVSGHEDAVDTVQQLTIQAPFFEVDEDDEDEGSSTAQMSLGASTSSAAPAPPPTTSACQVNWKQRSKLLQNVETVYQRPEDCPPANDTIVLGADPGEINALVVAKLDPRNGQKRHVVKITRKFLSAPYIKFRRLLEARKAATGIQDLESGIPPFSRATLAQYFTYMTGAITTANSSSIATTSSSTSTDNNITTSVSTGT